MPTAPKVVRADAEIACPRLDSALRDRGVDLVLLESGLEPLELAHAARDAHVLLTCYQPVPDAVLATATRLRAVIKYGVGIDAIDVEAARRHGIAVVNVPDYASDTVAEAAVMLMLALARKLLPITARTRAHGWINPTPEWLGADIRGSTVGLVGVGRIGTSMARIVGNGFGARVLGYDPCLSAAEIRSRGAEPCGDLHSLLAESDVVSIHATLTPRTRHLLGAAEFAAMRPNAYLINVSRGELVDESALLCALQDGVIAGAGLDTFGIEPLRPNGHSLSALLTMDNVVVMPHLAFYTAAAMRRLEAETLQRCTEAMAGEPLTVRSDDPRLASQTVGVRHVG